MMKRYLVTLSAFAYLLLFVACSDGEDGLLGSNGISCWDTNSNGLADTAEDVNNDGNFNSLDCKGLNGVDGSNGISCWDTNNNGSADPEEDINQDGNFDTLDCQGADGLNGVDGINCWDTNNNGQPEADEDVNQDGQFNSLDCQGMDGNDGENTDNNVTRIDLELDNYSGDEWEFVLPEQIRPISDHFYLMYLRHAFPKVWYDVPGNLTIDNTNDSYCRRFFREEDDTFGIRFYTITDNAPLEILQGEYDVLRIFAVRVSDDQSSRGGSKGVYEDMEAAGVDVSDYHQVAKYFGYTD